MKRLIFLSFWTLVLPLFSLAQPIGLDHIAVYNSPDARITKVQLSENDEHLVVAWMTDKDRGYFQTFNKYGMPVSDTTRIVTVDWAGVANRVKDVDVAIDNNNNVIVAWTEPSIITNFTIRYAVYDLEGERIQQPVSTGSSLDPRSNFIALSKSSNGTVALGWKEGNKFGVRLANPDGTLQSNIFYQAFTNADTDLHSWPIDISDNDEVLVASCNSNGWITLDINGGSTINATTMNAFNLDVDGDLVASIVGNIPQAVHSTETLIGFNGLTHHKGRLAFATLDHVGSRRVSIDLEETGAFVAWHNLSGVVKLNYVLRSGNLVGEPAVVPGGNAIKSMDVSTEDGVGRIVYVEDLLAGSLIQMRRYHFNPVKEEKEIPLNEKLPHNGSNTTKTRVITNGIDKHAVLWQYSETFTSDIYAQRLDENYQPLGQAIHITGNAWDDINDWDKKMFDAAMDADGNFMVVWQTSWGGDVRASKYSWNGTATIDDVLVHEPRTNAFDAYSSPRVAGNSHGDFIVTWSFGDNIDYGVVKARRCSDSFAPDIVTLGVYGSEPGLRQAPKLDMNDDGWIMFAHKTPQWQAVRVSIYDNNLQFIGSLVKPFNSLGDTYDAVLTNPKRLNLTQYRSDNLRAQVFDVSATATQVFDPDATALGPALIIGPATGRLEASVSTNEAGEFMLTHNGWNGAQVFQRLNTIGAPVGQQFRGMTFYPGIIGSIAYMNNQDVLIAWVTPELRGQVIMKAIRGGQQHAADVIRRQAEIEEGDSYGFYGMLLTKPGTYSHVTKRQGQGDLIDVLTLSVIQHPPSVPTNFTAQATDHSIELSWDANEESDIKGYIIYRGTTNNEASSVLLKVTAGLTYVDNAVQTGQEYFYWLKAQDEFNNTSPRTHVVSATVTGVVPDPDLPPAAPTGLLLTTTEYLVDLRWNANTESDLKGYNVYRAEGSGSFEFMTTTKSTSTSDLSAADGVTYRYKVHAIDNADNASGASAVVTGARHNLKPSAPLNLSLNGTDNEVTITWSKSPQPDVVWYKIYHNKTDNPGAAAFLDQIALMTFVHSHATEGSNYYWVTSVDQGGLESDFGQARLYTISTITGMEGSSPVSLVYPNPTTDEVYLERPVAEYSSVTLFDGRGSQLPLKTGRAANSISLGDLLPGLYIISVTTKAAAPRNVRVVLIK